MMGYENKSLALIESTFATRDGYSLEFHSSHWRLSRDRSISFSWMSGVLEDALAHNLRLVIKHYAMNYSANHTANLMDRFRAFGIWVSNESGKIDLIKVEDLISYRATLLRSKEWYLGVMGGLLKSWVELGIPGVSSDVPALFNSWSLRGNEKGVAVQTKDPLKGPLTDLEYETLQQALLEAFEVDQITLENFAIVTLFMATGRRPAQLADLKAKDLIIGTSSDGLKEFILNVPRRKQRAVSWRGEFKPVALVPENGLIVHALVRENEARLEVMIHGVSERLKKEFPIFPNWNVLKDLNIMDMLSKAQLLLSGESFHIQSDKLRTRLETIVKELSVHSERTNQPLNIFPTRLRRTLATRAAREGYGSLIIAELLDHTDDQNTRVYTENVPEHVDAINEAVARQLAPLAQAFAGVLVDREGDAIRGNDIRSRVRVDNGEAAGTCGHHGFCGALAPVACYTCRFFQPWLDGDHQGVLDGLLAERAHIQEITQDNTMTVINDRTIFAVTAVIQRCEARQQLISNG